MVETDYTLPIKQFVEATKINQRKLVRFMAAKLWTRIVEMNPVDTGRSRSGWDLSLNTPHTAIPPEGQPSYPEPAMPNFGTITGFENVWIANNVEYTPYLEQGHSQQAPAGMMRIAILELQVEMEDVIKQALALK